MDRNQLLIFTPIMEAQTHLPTYLRVYERECVGEIDPEFLNSKLSNESIGYTNTF